MATGTEWLQGANVSLAKPDTSYLQSAALGQQAGLRAKAEERKAQLHDIAVQDDEEEKSRAAIAENYSDSIMNAWKSGNMRGTQEGIVALQKYDPEAAEAYQKLIGNVDRTAFVGASHELFAAKALPMDDIKGSNAALERGIRLMGEDRTFSVGLRDIMNTDPAQRIEVDGEMVSAREYKLDEALNYAKGLGAFPEMVKQEQAEAELGAAAAGAAGKMGEQQRKVAKDLQASLDKQTKDFRSIRQAKDRIDAMRERGGPAASMAIVFNYMKMLDPNSVVRESEFRTAADLQAWVSKVESGEVEVNAKALPIIRQLRKAFTGEVINEAQVKDFADSAQDLFAAAQLSTDATIGELLQRADVENIPRERVLGAERLSGWQQRQQAAEQAAGQPAAAAAPAGPPASPVGPTYDKYFGEQTQPERTGPGQVAPAAPLAAQQPVPISSPEERASLPPGTDYIGPDGKIATKR